MKGDADHKDRGPCYVAFTALRIPESQGDCQIPFQESLERGRGDIKIFGTLCWACLDEEKMSNLYEKMKHLKINEFKTTESGGYKLKVNSYGLTRGTGPGNSLTDDFPDSSLIYFEYENGETKKFIKHFDEWSLT